MTEQSERIAAVLDRLPEATRRDFEWRILVEVGELERADALFQSTSEDGIAIKADWP